MGKFIKLDDKIFAIDQIAHVGYSYGVRWEIHIILKCLQNDTFKIKEFGSERDAQEYLSAIMESLTR